MDTDIDRDEARHVFRTALADPPPLGFSPEDVVRGADRGRRTLVLAMAAAAAAVLVVATGSTVLVGRLADRGGSTPAAPSQPSRLPDRSQPPRVPQSPPNGPPYAIELGDHAVAVLTAAARRAKATTRPDKGEYPVVELPGESREARTYPDPGRYRSGGGALLTVRSGTAEGTFWSSIHTHVDPAYPGRPLDPRTDLCRTDLSADRAEDSCRMVVLPDGTRVRVAHQTGTRPREVWTALLPGDGYLVEVVLTTAARGSTARQLPGRLFSDTELATIARDVADFG